LEGAHLTGDDDMMRLSLRDGCEIVVAKVPLSLSLSLNSVMTLVSFFAQQ
jgi:hypothetical protein